MRILKQVFVIKKMFSHVLRAVNTIRPSLARFNSGGVSNIPNYHPDSLDKKILVHFKYFKSVEDVPHLVSQSIMIQAKSKARIKTANMMIGCTIVFACITIFFARANSRNYSLIEENTRRHMMYKKGETGSGSRLGLVTHNKEKDKEE